MESVGSICKGRIICWYVDFERRWWRLFPEI